MSLLTIVGRAHVTSAVIAVPQNINGLEEITPAITEDCPMTAGEAQPDNLQEQPPSFLISYATIELSLLVLEL